MFGLLKKGNRKVCGPSFKESHERVLDFSGNKLIMTLPGLKGPMPTDWAGEAFKEQYNLYDRSLFFSAFNNRKHLEDPEKDVPGFSAYQDGFGFRRGTLLRPDDFGVQLNVCVRSVSRYGSLFKGENFEKSVVDAIQVQYGPHSWLGCYGRRFKAPIDWSTQKINGDQWIGASAMQYPEGSNYTTTWHVALTGEHFLLLSFERISYYDHGAPEAAAIDCFIQELLQKIRVERTPSVEAEKRQVELDKATSKISLLREPFLWLEYEEYPEKYLNDQERDWLEFEAEVMEKNEKLNRDRFYGLNRPAQVERYEERRQKAAKIREELEKQGKSII